MTTGSLKFLLKRGTFAIAIYVLGAALLLLFDPLWNVLVGPEPRWLASIGKQRGELLSFIAANLIVLSILTRKVEDSIFDTARAASFAAVVVAYAVAVSYVNPENVIVASLFMLISMPLLTILGPITASFWKAAMCAVVSYFAGLIVGVVVHWLFSLSINITAGIMLAFMLLSFFGSMYLLRRCRGTPDRIKLPNEAEAADVQTLSESSESTPESTDEKGSSLIGLTKDDYSSEYFAHVLEQYRLFVEMADRISQRRQRAHAFFLTLNMGLVVFLGLALPGKLAIIGSLWYVIVGAAGIVLSYAWFRLIKSYGDLNTGKFRVIHRMEEHLPLKPYKVEWDEVGHGEDSSLYKPFTRIEVYIPGMFALLYGILIATQFLL